MDTPGFLRSIIADHRERVAAAGPATATLLRCAGTGASNVDASIVSLSVPAPTVLVVASPTLVPRTDAELAGLEELVFVLHAVAAGMPVLPEALVPAVRYGLVHPGQGRRVALTPRGGRVLAIARGEVAAGMD